MAKVEKMKRNNVKKNSKKLKNNFLMKYSDETLAVNRVESFVIRNYVITNNLDDYMQGTQSTSRYLIVIFARFVLLLVGIRFAVSAIVNKQYMRALMSDSNYILGNHFAISSMMSISAIVILLIGITIQYQERNHSLYALTFLYNFQHIRLALPLSPMHHKRLVLHSNLLSKYFMS